MVESLFNVSMHCQACKVNIENRLKKVKGVKEVNANLVNLVLTVKYDEKLVNSEKIVEICKDIGYKCELIDDEFAFINDKQETKIETIKLIMGLVLLLPLMFLTMSDMYGSIIPTFLKEPIYLLPLIELFLTLIIIGIFFSYYKNGFLSLIKLAPNMDSLIFLGSFFSLVYSLYNIIRLLVSPDAFYVYEKVEGKTMFHTYLESAAMILVIVSLGKWIENFSKRKAKSTIKELVKLRPDTANVLIDNEIVKKSIKEIKLNDILIVKPGETIPLDAEIISGETSVNESLLTGESLPIYKKEGDKVIGGSINLEGSVKIIVSKLKKDNILNKIIKLVMEASNMDTKLTRKVDVISHYFVPVVLLLSLITLIFWLIFDLSMGHAYLSMHFSNIFDEAFSFGVSVLVISCPCALGLATPISLLVGSSVFSKNGILVNKSEAIESIKEIDTLVLDKTNTITEGKLFVFESKFFAKKEEYIDKIYSIEKYNEHPIGKSISEFLKDEAKLDSSFSLIKNIPGKGVKGIYNETIYVGNYELLKEINSKLINEEIENIYSLALEKGKLLIFAFNHNEIISYFILADKIKENAKEFIKEIKKYVKNIILLTGDNEKIAKEVASEVGINEVISEVLPFEKGEIIEKLNKENKKVMMVGDGVNDSLALTNALVSVGIAKGSDVALASSDFILMNSDLMDILLIFKLSKRIRKNINFNLIWAFGYNIIFIPVAAGIFSMFHFILTPMYASFLMALSSITVSLNSLALFIKSKH